MLKTTAKIATVAIAGTMMVAGFSVKSNAEGIYNSSAVAGITISVDNYVSTIEDTTPVQVKTETTSKATKSTKNAKLVMAKIENVLNVRKKASTDSKVVGQMYKGDAGTIIKKGSKWTKIKSGNVVGYVKNDFLIFGDSAAKYASKICPKTVKVTTTTLNVREKKSVKADIVTQIPGGLKYDVAKEYKDGWVKINIDDVQGYVSKDFVKVKVHYGKALTMKEIRAIEKKKADEAAAQAAADQAAAQVATQQQQQTSTQTQTTTSTSTSSTSTRSASAVKPSANQSSTSSSSMSSAGTSSSGTGSSIASYACRFIGNPYVHGGTSLTNGADCSGFVMSVFAHFGYKLPRTAAAQAGAGRTVSTSSLQPGDLLFYHGYGHVAIYIGGGKVVHASTRKTGIKVSAYNYSSIDKAVRVVR